MAIAAISPKKIIVTYKKRENNKFRVVGVGEAK